MVMDVSANLFGRAASGRSAVALIFVVVMALAVAAQTRRKVYVPGQRAVVFDERLSALRAQPDVKAALEQRLRRGRPVGILGSATGKDGAKFFRVAVSRNTRGWVLADAVARPGSVADGERLMKLIDETKDEFTKARLAKLCAGEFRSTKFAPKALMILGAAAESAAEKLSRDASRRVGDDESEAGLGKREYLLNYPGLDRYNRIGVTFDYDGAADRIVYDGAAYRELLRRYPRSDEAQVARTRLEKPKP
jgi:hypothetical protein